MPLLFGQLATHLATLLTALAVIGSASASPAAEGHAPNVVVSIAPLHSLVARLMTGIGTPTLLIAGNASPHSFTLRPSDARSLSAAQLVVWVGPILETSLRGPLATLAGSARLVTLIEAPDIDLLAQREGGVWDHPPHGAEPADKHGPNHDDGHADTDQNPANMPADAIDAHIWLSTENARAIVTIVAAELSALDPDRAAIYRRNREATLRDLDTLTERLRTQLAPVTERPFVVLHDGYQYFEHQFGLNAVGAIYLSPEIRAGARRLAELRAQIRKRNARCVFAEPQIAASPVHTVAEGTGARIGMLDPVGATLTPGPDLYGRLMTGLATGFAACLDEKG